MKIGRYLGKIRYRNENSLERQTFMFSFDSKNVLLLTSIELLRTLCVHFGSVFFFFLLQSFRKETGKLDKISGITRHKIRFITSYKRKLHQLLSLYLSISSIHFLFVYYVSAWFNNEKGFLEKWFVIFIQEFKLSLDKEDYLLCQCWNYDYGEIIKCMHKNE